SHGRALARAGPRVGHLPCDVWLAARAALLCHGTSVTSGVAPPCSGGALPIVTNIFLVWTRPHPACSRSVCDPLDQAWATAGRMVRVRAAAAAARMRPLDHPCATDWE